MKGRCLPLLIIVAGFAASQSAPLQDGDWPILAGDWLATHRQPTSAEGEIVHAPVSGLDADLLVEEEMDRPQTAREWLLEQQQSDADTQDDGEQLWQNSDFLW